MLNTKLYGHSRWTPYHVNIASEAWIRSSDVFPKKAFQNSLPQLLWSHHPFQKNVQRDISRAAWVTPNHAWRWHKSMSCVSSLERETQKVNRKLPRGFSTYLEGNVAISFVWRSWRGLLPRLAGTEQCACTHCPVFSTRWLFEHWQVVFASPHPKVGTISVRHLSYELGELVIA